MPPTVLAALLKSVFSALLAITLMEIFVQPAQTIATAVPLTLSALPALQTSSFKMAPALAKSISRLQLSVCHRLVASSPVLLVVQLVT